MKVKYTKNAIEDIEYFKANDLKIYNRIKALIQAVKDSPFRGLGSPEALKYNLSGHWSRRITREHRLVYRIEGRSPNQIITIIQARFHY